MARSEDPVSRLALDLDGLATGVLRLSPTVTGFYAEAAIVCLSSQGHASGVELRLKGPFARDSTIRWSEEREEANRSWRDSEEATQYGAAGLALLLIAGLTRYRVAVRSRKGTGFDYWLGHKLPKAGLFPTAACLEVSGIRRGSARDIKRRVGTKLRRPTSRRGEQKFYVIVIEFGVPQSAIVLDG